MFDFYCKYAPQSPPTTFCEFCRDVQWYIMIWDEDWILFKLPLTVFQSVQKHMRDQVNVEQRRFTLMWAHVGIAADVWGNSLAEYLEVNESKNEGVIIEVGFDAKRMDLFMEGGDLLKATWISLRTPPDTLEGMISKDIEGKLVDETEFAYGYRKGDSGMTHFPSHYQRELANMTGNPYSHHGVRLNEYETVPVYSLNWADSGKGQVQIDVTGYGHVKACRLVDSLLAWFPAIIDHNSHMKRKTALAMALHPRLQGGGKLYSLGDEILSLVGEFMALPDLSDTDEWVWPNQRRDPEPL